MTKHPNKHHFLPVFYLKQWAGSDKRLCQFSRPYLDRVVPKRVHPEGTGYIHRLYAIEGLPEVEAVAFESTFLSPVDSKAADALEVMRDEYAAGSFTAKQRMAWSNFLVSLMSRMPSDIRKVKEHVKGDWLAGVPELQDKYTQLKAPDDPESVLEFIRASDDLFFQRGAFGILRRIMDHKTIAQAIASLHWSILTVERANFTLLTSDRPILYTPHLMGKESHILVPIGPNQIFLAVRERRFARSIRDRSHSALVRLMNQAIVENADAYVYGVSDQQLEFVQGRMGKSPVPSLVDRLHQMRLNHMNAIKKRLAD
jgi:hypothetical protein